MAGRLRKKQKQTVLHHAKRSVFLHIVFDDVVQTLAADSHIGPMSPDHDHGGTGDAVVIGGHGVVVGTGGEDSDEIAPLGFRQRDIFLDKKVSSQF